MYLRFRRTKIFSFYNSLREFVVRPDMQYAWYACRATHVRN